MKKRGHPELAKDLACSGSEDAPDDLVLATADVPDNLSRERIQAHEMPARWRETPAPSELAQIGDEFAEEGRHLPAAGALSFGGE